MQISSDKHDRQLAEIAVRTIGDERRRSANQSSPRSGSRSILQIVVHSTTTSPALRNCVKMSLLVEFVYVTF